MTKRPMSPGAGGIEFPQTGDDFDEDLLAQQIVDSVISNRTDGPLVGQSPPFPIGRAPDPIRPPVPSISAIPPLPLAPLSPSRTPPPLVPPPLVPSPVPAASLRESIVTFLLRTQLFRGADPLVVQKTSGYIEVTEHPKETSIVRAGARADGLLIVFRGSAQIGETNPVTGQTEEIQTIQAGELFGEAAAIADCPHRQSLSTREGCALLHLRREVLEQLSLRIPSFGFALAKRIAQQALKVTVDPPLRSASDPGAIPFVEVGSFSVTARLLSMIPLGMIEQHRILPLQLRGKTLLVGMVAPKNPALMAELSRLLQGVDLETAAISADDFQESLSRLKVASPLEPRTLKVPGVGEEMIAFDVEDPEEVTEDAIHQGRDQDVRLLNRIIANAIERDASDIHMEVDAHGLRVRYRARGLLESPAETIPQGFGKAVVARIKMLAGLDISERRVPQDGRIGLNAAGRTVDLRVSIVPASRGEKVVLRLCEAAKMLRPLEQTFLVPDVLLIARRALGASSGLIAIAGGSGSGRSSTLYSMIHERVRLRPDSNVVMVEDPIEYRLEGVTQVETNRAVNLGFPEVLRAVLRQDPDVIAVGETREKETAQLVLEAASTGHLVLASFHANDAMGVIERLESLGLPRSLIAQSMSCAIAQRLIPRLCSACARLDAPPPILAESLQNAGLASRGSNGALPVPVGCPECQGTGYTGRLLALEMLEIDPEAKAAIAGGHGLRAIAEQAAQRGVLLTFRAYTAHLLARRLVSAADALLAVAR